MVEAMAHPLGCYCLDFDRHPQPEATAHLLGRYCLDLDRQPEPEATAHPLGTGRAWRHSLWTSIS
jgi:hypothetical protein